MDDAPRFRREPLRRDYPATTYRAHAGNNGRSERTSEEADAANGKISTTSPIGRGLLNKEVGDVVKVQIPGGMREFEILELATIHEIAEKP